MAKDLDYITLDNLTLISYGGGGCYSVKSCDKSAVCVTIPALYNGFPVIGVERNAFENCHDLMSVIFEEIPEDIYFNYYDIHYEIGDYAFSGCNMITEIELPYYLKTIGRGAFHSCKNLKKITFPQNAYLYPYAFAHCESLIEVTPVKYASEGLFSHCISLTTFPVQKCLKEIDEDSFEHCESLTEIVIPATVKRIGPLAFRGCYAMKKITFEVTDGWRCGSRYKDGEFTLDMSDPVDNAKFLAYMDFDDGVTALVNKWLPKNE